MKMQFLCWSMALPVLVLSAQDPVQNVKKALAEAGNAKQVAQQVALFDKKIKDAPNTQAAQAWMVGKLMLLIQTSQKPEPAFVASLKEKVPSDSPAWSLDPNAILFFVNQVMDPNDAAVDVWLEPALARQPDAELRAKLLHRDVMVKHYKGDMAGYEAALKRLRAAFPDHKLTTSIQGYLENEAKTAPGVQAPAFRVVSLEDPKTVWDNASFQGKYLLLDFWATWCGPCKAEMPHLHQMWAKFKGKNFEILSLSADRKPEDIAAYRKQPGLAMPWKHHFMEGEGRKALTGAFGVSGFPKAVLIGPDGKVITAKPSDLRGANLEKTLQRVLGE